MRGLKRLRSVQTISTGHGLVQNLRRDYYEFAVDTAPRLRLAAVFTELAAAVRPTGTMTAGMPPSPERNTAPDTGSLFVRRTDLPDRDVPGSRIASKNETVMLTAVLDTDRQT